MSTPMPAPFRPGACGPSTIEAGDRLDGRYHLLETVGRGGSGSVWRAHDELLGRDVAVKRLHVGRLDDPERARIVRDRARREGRVAARLHHPRLASIFDMTTLDGEVCLVMEFVSAPSLADLLDRDGPMHPGRVAHIGAQIAEGLAAMHLRGIVHRDIKPANIMIGAEDVVTVTDFGIAIVDTDPITADDVVAGTPQFMAPEIARGGTASAAADVFSLGATLFTLLEGSPPVGDGGNALEVLARVAAGTVRPASCPGALGDFLTVLLQPDPEHRPDAARVAEALGVAEGPGAPGSATVPLVGDDGLVVTPALLPSDLAGLSSLSWEAVLPVRTAPDGVDPAAIPAPRRAPWPTGDPTPDAPRRSRRRLALALGVVGAAGALGVLAAVPLSGGRAPAGPSTTANALPPPPLPLPPAPVPLAAVPPVAPADALASEPAPSPFAATSTPSGSSGPSASSASASRPTAVTARTSERSSSRGSADRGRSRGGGPPGQARDRAPGQSKPKKNR